MSELTLAECLHAAARDPEFVAQFDRLYGYDLSRRAAPIDLMVDDASGKTDAALGAFVCFVCECVYLRVAPSRPPVRG